MHVKIINGKRAYEFESERERTHGRVGQEEWEGIDVEILLKSQKKVRK